MSKIIGIDLGTTNTCTAFVSNKIPRVVPTEGGFNTMPSIVAFAEDGRVLVGQSAKDKTSPERTIHGIKRLLGRQVTSRVVQELSGNFPYKIVAGENGEAAVEVGGRVYSCSEVQAHILKHIKRYAEIHLGEEIPEAVIAVPAYYNDHQRALVKAAGQLAGWTVRRIINEPTAAALAYGFNRGFDQKILIYDLGGGTFDVSILELTGNVFQVVATGGELFLGGADFDTRVQDWIIAEFKKRTKIDLRETPVALARVRAAAERAKIELSLLMNTEIRLPNIVERRGKATDLELVLSRDLLNQLTKDLVARTITVVDALLKATAIDKSAIDEVIPVGGQTRMPLVVDAITTHFGKSPRKGIHPDECVALGAALLGDSLSKIDAVTLLDTLSVPIGIADSEGKLRVAVDRSVRLPHQADLEVPTSRDNQTSLELDLYQGEPQTPVRDCEYLGTLVYNGIPEAAAGAVQVKLELTMDAEGMLSVTATNSSSGNAQQIRLATIERPRAAGALIEERQAPSAAHHLDSGKRKGGLWGNS
ncbi:MAG: Hsp70 family protein [Deltaproteobacteria bacterium]|nr:Hsp70 family protein [Deltaproteobacteria bacterium]